MLQSSKLINLAKSTIISSVLDIININYSVIDPTGHYIAQNKSMKKAISKGLINAEHIDKSSWEDCKKIMKKKQKEIKEEKFNGKYYLSLKQPLIDNGNCIGILIISFDISKQKQAEIAKQEFLMNMAHDLRTPLSGIIALSNIQSKEGTSAEDRLCSQWIEDAGEQLLELLNSVLEVTAAEQHMKSLARDTIDFQQFAKELQALMKPAIIDKRLELELKLDNRLPRVIADRIKLKRIILNLLSNAVKFTKHGKICLQINTLTVKNNKTKIAILITDTGIGIPENKQDKIFDRFYRVHPSYQAEFKGYGIGLFLVKKAVELLDGDIKVSSKEGKGSCFTVTFNFPLAEEEMSEKSQQLLLKPNIDRQSQKILVAEDNIVALHVAKKLLFNLGYEVTAVINGKAALKALKTQDFQWALLDIGLPDLNGTEIVRRYRQWEQKNKKSHLPIFSLTAHMEKNITDKCKKVGFDYVLNKPFAEKDIYIIQTFLGK